MELRIQDVPAIKGNEIRMHTRNVLSSRRGRLAAFGIMYLSEGIPYGFSSTAMVAFMRIEGAGISQ